MGGFKYSGRVGSFVVGWESGVGNMELNNVQDPKKETDGQGPTEQDPRLVAGSVGGGGLLGGVMGNTA